MIPARAAANSNSNRSPGTGTNSDGVVLGDFENGLDGWRTNGGNDLEQVTDEDVPVGVTSGSHALQVEVNGDTYPIIENTRRVKDTDFTTNPYLGLHVIALVRETEADLRLQFRLHHTAGGRNPSNGNDSKGGGTSRNKDVNVVESEWKSISQLRPQALQWDMSGLSTDVRENAKRLEIVWYVEGHKPDSGHRGRTTGEFNYEGFVFFDDIRLYESPPISGVERSFQAERDLHRDHGMIVEREFEMVRDGLERGTLVFVDGTEVEYEFEVVDDDQFKHTIDGETFKIGGGWE